MGNTGWINGDMGGYRTRKNSKGGEPNRYTTGQQKEIQYIILYKCYINYINRFK